MLSPAGAIRSREGGVREVLAIALPLVLSTAAHSVLLFADSVFLMWVSKEAMAASALAGITFFMFGAMFVGVAGYVNTFVAQYVGAGRRQRVGPSIWQGVWFSLAAGFLLTLLSPCSEVVFRLIGHEHSIQGMEVEYFEIITLSYIPMLLHMTLSCFYTGRGKTWTVMAVNTTVIVLNILFDLWFIFGGCGLPAMGIAGAAWASVLAESLAVLIFVVLLVKGNNRLHFATLSGWRPVSNLFRRLLKYGMPNGAQILLDVFAFNFLLIMVGRIDAQSQEATTMAFRINMLVFIPLIGIGIAVTTLVGQALGRDRADLARQSVVSAMKVGLLYMGVCSIGIFVVPQLFTAPFFWMAEHGEREAIETSVNSLLKIVAVYSLFDVGNIIFSSGLKGAGDTRFVVLVSLFSTVFLMVVPCVLVEKTGGTMYHLWFFAACFVVFNTGMFFLRFRGRAWESMRVIETE